MKNPSFYYNRRNKEGFSFKCFMFYYLYGVSLSDTSPMPLGLPSASQETYLPLYHRFYRVAGRAEVFARVEFTRVFRKDLPYRPCHREAQVGIDVDLAYPHLRRPCDHLFGDAPGARDLSAVVVAGLDEVGRHGRSEER